MGIPNKELIEKALITTDALAAAGKLSAAQSDKFIDYVIEETMLSGNARVIKFRNESLEIDKIGIGRRVAMPKAEASDPLLRRGITTSKVTITPREIIVPFEISDNFKETNIEGDAIEDHVIKLMAKQLANDLEDLYINGDQLGHATLEADIKEGGSATQYIRDTYMSLMDGWSRLADSGHVVDNAGANVGLTLFSSLLRAMPTKYRRNKKDLRFLVSPDLEQLYIEKLAARNTALGDQATEGATHTPFGVKMIGIPLWDLTPIFTQHVTLNGTTAAALRYAPVTSVIVLPSALGATPTTPYVSGTDYTLNAAAGTVTRIALGAIGDGDVVKVTAYANPQIILTHMDNFIVGIGRDIRIERDRDIYKGMNQFAITCKVGVALEETDAVVKGINIGTT